MVRKALWLTGRKFVEPAVARGLSEQAVGRKYRQESDLSVGSYLSLTNK